MRRDRVYVLCGLLLTSWLLATYWMFVQKPVVNGFATRTDSFGKQRQDMERQMEELHERLSEQMKENNRLLAEIQSLKEQRLAAQNAEAGAGGEKPKEEAPSKFVDGANEYDQAKVDLKEDIVMVDNTAPKNLSGGKRNQPKEETTTKKAERKEQEKDVEHSLVMPVLMFACNRPAVNRALDSLLQYRTQKKKFPIIVSQDCGHQETKDVILGYGDDVVLIEQPDQSDIAVPAQETKFKGYFKIARHYGWALNHTFNVLGYHQVIIVEDDLEVSPDFFEYFEATLPVLRGDPSLFCVSAWNDNGKTSLINETRPELLYRTDFFGGLGWMMTKELWSEFGPKWPKSYWDDWVREPPQRRERACIRPEVSRTKTFGKVGVSNGLFFDKHLKFIKLNDKKVEFTKLDLSYLRKDLYDAKIEKEVNEAPVVSVDDLKNGAVGQHNAVRLVYHTKLAFKSYAKALGLMDDFRAGVPRMGYKGVVPFFYRNQRVFVAPSLNWKGYDPTW